jgi:hypothetical protein
MENEPMIERRIIAPPHLQFFISDQNGGEPPLQGSERLAVISSGTCISVPCAYWGEAETNLVVGPGSELMTRGRTQAFDGVIPTPSGTILFSDSETTTLLEYPATGITTRVRVWTDGLELPEVVLVAID